MTIITLHGLSAALGIPAPLIRGTIAATRWASQGAPVLVSGADVVFPATVRVQLVDGEPAEALDLPPSTAEFCYKLTVSSLAGGTLGPWFVAVPEGGPVDIGDLVRVDPATFEPLPVEVSAAWDEALGQAQAAAASAAAAKAAAEGAATRAEQVAAEVSARDLVTSDTVEALRHDTARRGRFPVMSITLDAGVDPADRDTYLPGSWTITDTDQGVIQSGTLRLKGRGNSTWARPKKPWRINFDTSIRPLGMTAKQKNWALLANDFDASKLNNGFALSLGARLSGLAWTPQYRTVELVLNGAFRGIYMLADLVRMEPGRVGGTEPSAGGDGSDGSWLLEISNKERPGNPAATGDPGFATPIYNQWVFYDTPALPTPAQEAYISALIGSFEQSLKAGDWAGWQAKADATSFADWWLVNELVANTDSAFWSSCKAQVQGGKVVMGPLWDQDLSLGIILGAEILSPTVWRTRGAAWITRMWKDASWRALVQSRWAALLASLDAMGGASVWLDQTIDGQDAAILRDDRKWSRTTYTLAEVDRRKTWLAARIAWLNAQIIAPIDPVESVVTPTV